MTLFCSPSGARSAPTGRDWLYLGKDPREPERLERLLGRPPRRLGSALHEEARRLKQPFLELLEALGRGQEAAAWWAGSLAGRAWDFSDFFLLCGYLSLCRRFAAEGAELTVVVEDPWLLAQLRGSPEGLFSEKLRCLALGLARRAKWALRMALGRVRQAWHSRGRSAPPPGGVLIYSHLVPRSLKAGGGWDDPFLTGLDSELAERGVTCARLTYSDVTGFEAEAGLRKGYLHPALLWASGTGFLRALCALPPAPPAEARLGDLPVGLLLEREWWHDAARASRCAYLLFLDCAARFLAGTRFKAAAMLWEGQPQERMLVLAAKAAGVRCVGYQHTTVPEFQLPFYSSPGEYADSPVPDALLTSGEHPARALREAGFPAGRLSVGGTRRFGHFLQGAAPRPPLGRDVVVLLPIDAWQARHLLAALERAYPDGLPGGRFLLRPHPSGPDDVRRARFPADLAEGPLGPVLARSGAALYTGSTAGLDALCAGLPVLRYRSDLLLDVDPTDMFPDTEIPTASDSDLRERLEALRFAPPPPPGESVRRRLADLFSPLDRAAWEAALRVP